ncbi:hypothetical protein OSB04_008690 [Centaurea solstitialis]|uniref:Uncharacterized protein n=1 Tax=Centaurea solstitialis TaxID=347529 RepID=A0AA38TZ20_9ASTR|nr:hypothetical protein OSB04_008690 [Centaurea solstitialis]
MGEATWFDRYSSNGREEQGTTNIYHQPFMRLSLIINYVHESLLEDAPNVALYVDVMNIIDTLDEIRETTSYLKSEFEMKDLGKTWFYLAT